MRLDRFITLNLVYPLKQNIKMNRGVKIPILMYHSISDEWENGHPYYWLNTSPKRFYEQMKFLKDNRYKVISLGEAVNLIKNSASPYVLTSSLPQDTNKYVVLTFDDGYRTFLTNALPILLKFEFSATLYLPTNHVGTRKLKKGERLDWDEIRELRKSSIDVGSHTVNHLQLKNLKKKEIEYEIKKSKEIIEKILGETIYSFSYPYAFPEADKELKIFLKKILEGSGYQNGVTTIIGMATGTDAPFFLKRLPINSGDDLLFFRAKLEGSYEWMHLVQYAKKFIKDKLNIKIWHSQ